MVEKRKSNLHRRIVRAVNQHIRGGKSKKYSVAKVSSKYRGVGRYENVYRVKDLAAKKTYTATCDYGQLGGTFWTVSSGIKKR